MNLGRLLDMMLRRPSPPNDERSITDAQTEELRAEVGAALDRVDRIVPPKHHRLASYARVRIQR
jgi:hypothetical protein